MLKYNLKSILEDKLSSAEEQQAMKDIPALLGCTPKHFKHFMLKYKIDDKGAIREPHLHEILKYLIENFPEKFINITIHDLINEPEELKNLRVRMHKRLAQSA